MKVRRRRSAYRYRASAVTSREGKEVVAAAAVNNHIACAMERNFKVSGGGGAIKNNKLARFSAVEPGPMVRFWSPTTLMVCNDV